MSTERPTPAKSDRHRNETPAERQDRLWGDLLQELRVLQTGAQLTAGFLLTLPFQENFEDLDAVQRGLYLVLVVLALATTALVMSAVAVHQRLSGRGIKKRVVDTGRRLLRSILATLALLVVGLGVLLFDMVIDRWAALGAGVGLGLLLVFLLLVLPRLLLRDADDDDSAEDVRAEQERDRHV